jgi:ABC-type transport system substrate-binding protein
LLYARLSFSGSLRPLPAASWHRYFSSANFPPNGFNFEQWKDDAFDNELTALAEASDPAVISGALRKAHGPKVKGVVSPQSWFIDLPLVSMP